MKSKGIQQYRDVINIMKQQLKSFINSDYFSPWDDDREMSLVGISSAVGQMSGELKKQESPRKNRFRMKQQNVYNTIEDQAKKTLLNVEHDQSGSNVERLKSYVDSKKNINLIESNASVGYIDFKLPPINRRKQNLNIRNSSNRQLQNQRKSFLDKIMSKDNQEQQIFKKYGDHRKIFTNKVERSISFGSVISKNQNQVGELKRKYETVDAAYDSSAGEKELKDLRLRGKKYACDIRSERSRKSDTDLSYIPTRPNLTPHYVLFGHSKQDILKNVLKQLQNKFNQLS